MRKVVVIGGLVAFGKSPLGALVEKLGVSWVPMQDTTVHQYSEGKLGLEDLNRLGEVYQNLMENLSTPKARAQGLSFSSNYKTAALFNQDQMKQGRERLRNQKFSNFEDFWFEYRNLALDAICYKPVRTRRDIHVIIPGNSHLYEKEYRRLFSDVKFIYIRRGFVSWMNSRIAAEQNYYKRFSPEKKRNKRPDSVLAYSLRFDINEFISEYKAYEIAVSESQALIVDFDEIFEKDPGPILKKLSEYLELPMPDVEATRGEKFDLFGGMYDYEKAYTKVDDRLKFISSVTSRFYEHLFKKTGVSLVDRWIGRVLFLKDYYLTSSWGS